MRRLPCESKRKALEALRDGDQVQPPTAAKCDAAITVDEILLTCAHLPLGKSPGPDRLPNKFYRMCAVLCADGAVCGVAGYAVCGMRRACGVGGARVGELRAMRWPARDLRVELAGVLLDDAVVAGLAWTCWT